MAEMFPLKITFIFFFLLALVRSIAVLLLLVGLEQLLDDERDPVEVKDAREGRKRKHKDECKGLVV